VSDALERTEGGGWLSDWDGVCNARDLGGLRLIGGGMIRSGALVRTDNVARLTSDGWRSLHRFGIGTIVDLRDPAVERSGYRDEAGPVDIVRIPVFDLSDEAFWLSLRGERDAGRFYRAALERWPGAFAAAVCAIARARPGGVVVHCQAGKDRTGLVTALTLASVGVERSEIALDYEHATCRVGALLQLAAYADEVRDAANRTQLRLANTAGGVSILEALDSLDLSAYLAAGGFTSRDASALRERLVEVGPRRP
jgi:protein-tyrosine phosphatase